MMLNKYHYYIVSFINLQTIVFFLPIRPRSTQMSDLA